MGIFSCLSLAIFGLLYHVVVSQTKNITIERVVKGDVLTINPIGRFKGTADAIDPYKVFFPRYPAQTPAERPRSKGEYPVEFYDMPEGATKSPYNRILGYRDFKSAQSGYLGAVQVWNSYGTFEKHFLVGQNEQHLTTLLSINITLQDKECNKVVSFLYKSPLSMNLLDMMYCLNSTGLGYIDTQSHGSEENLTPSQLKLDTKNPGILMNTIETVRLADGKVMGYLFFNTSKPKVTSGTKSLGQEPEPPISPARILLIHPEGGLQEVLIDVNPILKNLSLPELLVLEDAIIHTTTYKQNWALITIKGIFSNNGVNNHILYGCNLNTAALTVKDCFEIERNATEDPFFIDSSVYKVDYSAGVRDVVLQIILESPEGPKEKRYQITEQVDADGGRVSGTVKLLSFEEYHLAQAANLKDTRIEEIISGFRLYHNKSDAGTYDKMFLELVTGPGQSILNYDTEINYMAWSDALGYPVGVSLNGRVAFYPLDSPRIQIDTKLLEVNSTTNSSLLKAFYYNRETSLYDYFNVTIKFIEYYEFTYKGGDIVHTITNEPRRLRFSDALIDGPAFDLAVAREGTHPEYYSSTYEKIVYYEKNQNNPSQLNAISMNSGKYVGTLDQLINLDTNTIRTCRGISRNVKDREVSVLCNPTVKFIANGLPNYINRIHSARVIPGWLFVIYSEPQTDGLFSLKGLTVDLVHLTLLQTLDLGKVPSVDKSKKQFQSAILTAKTGGYFIYFTKAAVAGEHSWISYSFSSVFDSNKTISNVNVTLDQHIAAFHPSLVDTALGLNPGVDMILAVSYNLKSGFYYFNDGKLLLEKTEFQTHRSMIDHDTVLYKLNRFNLYSDPNTVGTVNKFDEYRSLHTKVADSYFVTPLELFEGRFAILSTPQFTGFTRIRENADVISERLKHGRVLKSVAGTMEWGYYYRDSLYFSSESSKDIYVCSFNDRNLYLDNGNTNGTDLSIDILAGGLDNPNLRLSLTQKIEVLNATTEANFTDSYYVNNYNNTDKNIYKIVRYIVNSTTSRGHYWKIDVNANATGFKSIGRFTGESGNYTEQLKLCDATKITKDIAICINKDQVNVVNAADMNKTASWKTATFFQGKVQKIISVNGKSSLFVRADNGIYDRYLLMKLNADFGVSEWSSKAPYEAEPEDDERVTWVGGSPIVALNRRNAFDTLVFFDGSSGAESSLKIPFVEKFDIFSTSEAGLDKYVFVIYSTYTDNNVKIVRLEAGNLNANVNLNYTQNYSAGRFDEFKCKFAKGSQFTCILAGASILWQSYNLESATNVKTLSSEEYYAYKNLEVEQIEMHFDWDNQPQGFVLLGSRPVRETNLTVFDTHGLLYYRAIRKGGNGYASGGLNDEDLLALEIGSTYSISLENYKLQVYSGSQTRSFIIQEPMAEGVNVPVDLLKNGISLNVHGIQGKRSVTAVKAIIDTNPLVPDVKPAEKSKWLWWVIVIILLLIVAVVVIGVVKKSQDKKGQAEDHYMDEVEADASIANKTAGAAAKEGDHRL